MLGKYEISISTLCLILSLVFLTVIIFRIRNVYIKKNARLPVWNEKVGILNRVGKLAMAVSLFLMALSVIFYISIVALPSAVISDYWKTLFSIVFGVWTLLEVMLCCSIPEKLIKGSLFPRISFFIAVIFFVAVVMYMFPLISKSIHYPAMADCVMLELPVRGKWLARHAGATKITNGHHLKYPYAIDILKIGPDGQLRKGREKSITDFYSYNEPIYAPADGRVVKVVDDVEGDLIGNNVIIDIGNEKYVFITHMRNGSITVKEGQFVVAGNLLGRVGNSGGRSGILHLHMHVQNKATFDHYGKVITYPFRFRKMVRKRFLFWEKVSNGYLLRNDRFSD